MENKWPATIHRRPLRILEQQTRKILMLTNKRMQGVINKIILLSGYLGK
jgi:hypothetical protein